MRAPALAAILAASSAMAQDYTITFRSLEETSSSSLPSFLPANDSSFVFDGTNSDIAQQLYIRHQAGDIADALELNSIPAFVTKRLDPLMISFGDLPGLAQRALLWDSGFAISPDNDPVQIWAMPDYTMANISVPKEDIAEVNCTTLECPQPNGVPAYSSQYCTGAQILNVSRCVADTFEDSGASGFLGVMWSTGGNANVTPHMRLRDHSWTEPTTGTAYELYAIHTVSSADDPTWNQCPANKGYSSLIVPCHKRSEFTDSEIAAMTKPAGSDWVTNWLKEEFAVKKSGFNKLLLIPITLGSLPHHNLTWSGGGFIVFAFASLPSNDSFVFDGTHSDIAQQLYIRHQAGDIRDRVALKFVPPVVSDRLSPLNIDFDDLPGIVQRAVLWDTGFAIAPGGIPVQIWPMGDRTMADIAVEKQEVLNVNCTFASCPQPNNVTAYYTQYCTGYQMGNTSHCVAGNFGEFLRQYVGERR
ncbi:TKL/DRK protein kinase [Phytophthora cinnamomi]|uniref:TKL/DRK protein kinase n=1 Tax=Phytophthora cinnamomi TaxID=4785 RepID=UPI0035594939|nr:TKL/DRK protein kinase [Phytophthora cinnamomi]